MLGIVLMFLGKCGCSPMSSSRCCGFVVTVAIVFVPLMSRWSSTWKLSVYVIVSIVIVHPVIISKAYSV